MRFFSLIFLIMVPFLSFAEEGKPEFFNIEEIRASFPIFSKNNELVYLDSAATTHKPKSVIDKTNSFYSDEYGTVHRAGYKLGIEATKSYNNVRRTVRDFLHARHADEIIFTKGTTESINLVALSFGKGFIHEGDEIIISQMEHHSNMIPWQLIAYEKGAKLLVIPMDRNGNLLLEEYEKLLSNRTKLVAITQVANTIGTINPVKEMIKKAHALGARVLVDGAQAVGHMPVDVQDLDADFYVFSGHKIYGPTGVGVLYGKRELLNEMPVVFAGGTMATRVTLDGFEPKKLPLKFEPGTPMIAEVIGLRDAIDFIESIGRENIEKQDRALMDYTKERLKRMPGVQLVGNPDEQAGVIGFSVEGIYSFDLEKELDRQNISIRTGTFCAQPTVQHFDLAGFARISIGVYTSYDDIDRFLYALGRYISSYYSRPSYRFAATSCLDGTCSMSDDFIDD